MTSLQQQQLGLELGFALEFAALKKRTLLEIQEYRHPLLFSNENFKEVCEQFGDFGKKPLVPTGAGDYSLELVYRKKKEIYTFDPNHLNKHAMVLKIASILSLDYEEFLEFYFGVENGRPFNKNLFQKVRKNLESSTDHIFELLFEFIDEKSIYENLFFCEERDSQKLLEQAKKNFSFYSREEYNQLKKQLETAKIHFSHARFYDLEKSMYRNIYDFSTIYVSNPIYPYTSSAEDALRKMLANNLNRLGVDGYFLCSFSSSPKIETKENWNPEVLKFQEVFLTLLRKLDTIETSIENPFSTEQNILTLTRKKS